MRRLRPIIASARRPSGSSAKAVSPSSPSTSSTIGSASPARNARVRSRAASPAADGGYPGDASCVLTQPP